MWFRDGHILQNAQGPVICNVTPNIKISEKYSIMMYCAFTS